MRRDYNWRSRRRNPKLKNQWLKSKVEETIEIPEFDAKSRNYWRLLIEPDFYALNPEPDITIEEEVDKNSNRLVYKTNR